MEENYENNSSIGNGYGQNGSDQNNYGQSNYSQNNYNPNGYDQNNYGQNNYNQSGYDQNNYGQNNYNPNSYDQNSYGQNNYGQNNYAQNGYNQNNYGQANYSQNSYGSNGYYGNTVQRHLMYGISEPTAATEAVREVGKSFPFLFGTICYTLAMILSIVSLIFANTGFNGYLSGEAEILRAYQLIGSFIGMIPLALVVVGMWMFFSSCTGNRRIPSTVGITLSRGAIITYIVLSSIVIGFFAICMGIIIFGLTMTGNAVDSFMYYEVAGVRTEFLVGVGAVIVLFVVVFLILILTLVYFIKMLKTTGVIRNVLRTGQVVKNISIFHIVINFVVVVGNIFIMAVNFINAPYMNGAMPMAIQAALTAISYGAVTVALVMLRSRLSAYIQPRG